MKRYWIIVLAIVLAACGGGGQKANFSDATDRLEVVSWWVSPSEHPAFEVLLNAFRAGNPDVEVIDGAIAGGGGSNVQVALAARLQAGNPPDVWQTFLGSSLRAWVDAGRIVDVSRVFESSGLDQDHAADAARRGDLSGQGVGCADRVPPRKCAVVQPAGAERSRCDAAGSRLHGGGLRSRSRQSGGKREDGVVSRREGPVHVRPSCSRTLCWEWSAPTAGRGFGDDSFDWRGSQLRQALTQFGEIVSRADPDAPGLTWDQAAKKLATGQCAFLSMNDSVYGELVANKAVEGKDFGYVAYPGTSGAYLAIVDTFVVSADAEDGVNAMKFMETIADPKTSLEFNKVKGSVPIRDDVDVASLPPYQRQASKALFNDKILLSMTHGEVMSTDFQQALYDAVAVLLGSKNADGFIDTLQSSIEVPVAGR